MRESTTGRRLLWMAISQLYGYIFCMLVSNVLVGMPLFGGALYLCGSAAEVLVSVYSKKNRKYLPAYTHRWGVVIACVLGVIGIVLMGLYPAGFQSPRVWVVFASVALCLCADGMGARIRRLRGTAQKTGRRAWTATFLVQVAIIAAEALILFTNTDRPTALELTGGFALLTLFRAYLAYHLYRDEPEENPEDNPEETPEKTGKPELTGLPVYRSFETISLMIVMAVELTVSSIYALLATGSDSILTSIAVGVGCTLAASEVGMLILRRSRKPSRKDPTWLLCTGLLLWLAGVVLCVMVLRGARLTLTAVYICLALCSAGGALSFAGVLKIEELMPEVAEAMGVELSGAYQRVREANWNLALLMGDLLSLVALTVFCFVNGNELPQDMEQLANRFQPVMAIPLLLAVISALVSAFRFPLSARYIDKLRLLLHLKQKGEENPALRRQVEHVVTGKYRQPWLTRFLEGILRPFYKHTLVNTDHIVTDKTNPLVLLGNHGEIYGPIACALYLPIPVRAWTISTMMIDQQEIVDYLYTNTFSKKTFLPVFVRKALARLIGWLSVRVMNQLENIPVYKDSPMKLRETIRQSIEALESGDNLLIFPEAQGGIYQRSGGIGKLAPGYVMLAQAYWQRKGKRLRMLPLYANREERTITFGDEIQYRPENGFQAEQERIMTETRDQINRMAGIEEQK